MLLVNLSYRFYVFCAASKQGCLYQRAGFSMDIISLIVLLFFGEIPHTIRCMDCYIASDSGNVYIHRLYAGTCLLLCWSVSCQRAMAFK
ncbi:MAG: hypothetical protein CMIDDMOC_00883 [Sodalis sp. Fle]|nr:MAG: hypothetical protein CMIDDMOC_00883 [Sodalis sp. Fle]